MRIPKSSAPSPACQEAAKMIYSPRMSTRTRIRPAMVAILAAIFIAHFGNGIWDLLLAN